MTRADLSRADVVQTWRDAANEIRQMTLGRISFEFVPSIDDQGLIITPATSTPVSCEPSMSSGLIWTRYPDPGRACHRSNSRYQIILQ
jgi:hypothetical protein